MSQQSAQTQQQFQSLTAAQQKTADDLVKQGATVTQAIAQSQAQTQEQIANLSQQTKDQLAQQSAQTQQQFQNLTAAQQNTANALVAQGTSLTNAISQVQAQGQAQFNALTAGQQAQANALIAQGTSLTSAINQVQSNLGSRILAQNDKIAQSQQQGADTKLSYRKVSDDAQILNPLLFSLAGVPVPSTSPEQTLTKQEEQDTTEEENNKREAPALDLFNFFSFAEGGMVPSHPMGEPEFYSEGGAGTTYIQGRGDGTSDQIPAMVANSEYVLPADIVSALGNGSSDSGADILDQFIKTIRAHKHSNPPDELPPESKGPLEYLSSVHMKGRR